MNPYSNPQFDCIKHINTLFPNEQSLINIDAEINKLSGELTTLQSELQEDIHQHAIMQQDIWKEVQQVDSLARGVVQEIQDIKQKAEKSEELIYSMCKDIKSLDIAKRNLTFSITALKKFIMMLTAIEKLRESCQSKQYKDIAMLLEAFDELGQYFKKFENIPQITEINNDKETIIKSLKLQLVDDFLLFGKGNSLLTSQDMLQACAAVETMGLKFKNELIKRVCKFVVDPYIELFQQSENNNLEKTERRYAWLLRAIQDFDQKFPGVFPEYWGVHVAIYYEFASVTRSQITDILERKQEKEDVAVLMKALQQTLKFEQRITEEMKKRYEIWMVYAESQSQTKSPFQLNEISKKFVIDSLPKFKGCISDTFEPYLRPYIENEERELHESIVKSLNGDETEPTSDIKVMNSSFYMFNYFKQLLKRASQYSRSQVMFDIYRLIKKNLKFYADEIGNKVQREYRQMTSEPHFHVLVCFAINTAEYCKETIPNLEESLTSYLDSPFSDQVDLQNEEEAFNQMMNKTVETMIIYIDSKLDPNFQKMLRINWEQYENMGDVSDYIKETKIQLDHHIGSIKELLSETYLIFYLNKLVVYINNKFINSVFRIKKITEVGLSQLMLDIYDLRMSLISISKLKIESKSQTSYTNFVNKTLLRSETILKLIQMSLDKFVENFGEYAKKYPTETVQQDFDKILIVKGLRRQDVPNLVKLFQK